MTADPPPSPSPSPRICVPEVRDFAAINRELAALLDRGASCVVLEGVERQRLLAAGLKGEWTAVVVVEGDAGPDLAAGLDAPNLVVLCRGSAADAAGSGMIAGALTIEGDAGDGLGYGLKGGTITVEGSAGHRAGLMQSGGLIRVVGSLGRLAAERQSGGLFVATAACVGPHAGRGPMGGRLVLL